MDRGWYARFGLVAVLAVSAWLVLWPSLDRWVPAPEGLRELVTQRISPGLDIQGGLRLMYEVEVDEAVRDRRDLRADQLLRELGVRLDVTPEGESPTQAQLEELRKRVQVEREGDRRIVFEFVKPDEVEALDRELVTRFGDLREVTSDSNRMVLEINVDFLDRIREVAVQQARETIKNRIDGLGLKEAAVTAQNADIIVEVPGADEEAFDRIRDLISRTARLEFKIVDEEGSQFLAGLTALPAGIEQRSEVAPVGAGVSAVVAASMSAD